MESLKRIGMFFAYWIATIVGCFLTVFIVRFLVHFDIASTIRAPIDILAEAAIVFVVVGFVVAFKCKK